MDDHKTADDIRHEMAQIRRGLRPEVESIVDNARMLTNWRYYVKAFPWLSLAAASAVGYMLVPRKLEIIQPDPNTIARLVKEHKLVVEHRPQAHEKTSLTGQLVGLLANVFLRAAVAYAGQQMGKVVGSQAAQPDRVKAAR